MLRPCEWLTHDRQPSSRRALQDTGGQTNAHAQSTWGERRHLLPYSPASSVCYVGKAYRNSELSQSNQDGLVLHNHLNYCVSGFCTLSTTGTDVHGIIPTSVITMETKWGGVTSYTKFNKWSELTSLQSDRTSAVSLPSGTRSSGSPNENRRVQRGFCKVFG